MNIAWAFLTLLSLVSGCGSWCSPTTYYKNCWIRRFPGIFIDIDESQKKGAQLLKLYQEETALKCSRTCCLTENFSCNLALFHYDITQENPNCFHLHCPNLESCILTHKGNVVLYNITKGADPDLLVFGKYFSSNTRVLPHHYGRSNGSDLLPSDKRQFIHPPAPPLPAKPSPHAPPLLPSTTTALVPVTNSTWLATVSSTSTSTNRSFTLLSDPPTASVSTVTSSALTFTVSPLSMTVTTTSPHHLETSSVVHVTDSPIYTHHHASTPLEFSDSPTTATAQFSNTGITEEDEDSTEMNHTASGGEDNTAAAAADEHEPAWHMAAHTVLVAVAICVSVLLSCCCSILLLVSWRGQKKRMGRYRTSWRRKKGSMRLIKYVLVRESS